MGLIKPAKISEHEFRTLWEKYNWENKIDIKTNIREPVEFVNYIKDKIGMEIIGTLNPYAEGRYLTANLYAETFMGFSFLLNMSVEKVGGQIQGHIRLRCKQRVKIALVDLILR